MKKGLEIANYIRNEINEILSRYDIHPDAYNYDVQIDATCVLLADRFLGEAKNVHLIIAERDRTFALMLARAEAAEAKLAHFLAAQ